MPTVREVWHSFTRPRSAAPVPQRQPLVLDRGPTSVWSPADSVSGTSCSCFLAAAAVAALFSVESFYIITRNAIESATECL